MNKFILLLGLGVFIFSCKSEKNENSHSKSTSQSIQVFKVLNESLQTSNKNLSESNNTIFKSFEAKINDPGSRGVATIWYPKAQKIHQVSDELIKYLDGLKVELKKEAGFTGKKNGDGSDKFKEDDQDAAARLFGKEDDGKNKGPELENKLSAYKKAVLNIDPSFKKNFERTFPVDANETDFTKVFFMKASSIQALVLLTKFQNNVLNAENQLITFCHAKVGAVQVKFDAYSAMVSQSSNFLMPGEELEITAGLGAYSTTNRPTVIIAGSAQTLDADGKATYKVRANGAGSRSVPVTVTYKDPRTNQILNVQKDIKYTIGTPGGAAVVPDKMNVLYIGVDNPITIGSPTGWDKTKVSITNGSISGNGSVRNVRVNNPGNATITVEADGNPMTFSFRVKRIPDPIFKVGSGKIRMTSTEFKAQQFCRADLENFDFDLKYNVVGGNVYFSGANFPNVITATISSNDLSSIKQYMMKCGPGSCVAFDNIKVQGPDGIRTISGKSIQLY